MTRTRRSLKHVRLCLLRSSRKIQTRACASSLRLVVMLSLLHHHGSGRYSAATVPSNGKLHESNAQMAAARPLPQEAIADVDTGTGVEEVEEEAVGAMIVFCTALLCNVSGAALNTEMRIMEVRAGAPTVGSGPLDLLSVQYRIPNKATEKSRLPK